MDMLAQHNRKGELARLVGGLSVEDFASTLEDMTAECQQFLRVVEMSHTDAFESMLEQVLESFTLKIGEILDAERVSLFLVDEARGELFSKVAQHDGERPLEIRIPLDAGIAGRVASTGKAMNIADAYAEPLFNRAVDQETGYRTRTLLCVPISDQHGRVFAVAQVLNKRGDAPFAAARRARFARVRRLARRGAGELVADGPSPRRTPGPWRAARRRRRGRGGGVRRSVRSITQTARAEHDSMEPHATTPAAIACRRAADHRSDKPRPLAICGPAAANAPNVMAATAAVTSRNRRSPRYTSAISGSMLAMIAPVAINNTPSKPHSSGSSSGVKSMTIMCASLNVAELQGEQAMCPAPFGHGEVRRALVRREV